MSQHILSFYKYSICKSREEKEKAIFGWGKQGCQREDGKISNSALGQSDSFLPFLLSLATFSKRGIFVETALSHTHSLI